MATRERVVVKRPLLAVFWHQLCVKTSFNLEASSDKQVEYSIFVSKQLLK